MDWYVKRVNGKIVTACPGFVAGMAEDGPIPENDPKLVSFLNPEIIIVATPTVFASIGVVIEGGQVALLEMPANIQSVSYEEGWLMAVFNSLQPDTKYQIFPVLDKPAIVEQFKNDGYFELVFSDNNGNPVEPLRLDIQIIKVR